MRSPSVHETVQASVAASTSSIWLAHHFAPELECLAAVAVSIIATVSVDVERHIYRLVRRFKAMRRRADRDLAKEI